MDNNTIFILVKIRGAGVLIFDYYLLLNSGRKKPRKPMHYCYILRSLKSGMFYIDTANDVERGVSMHNGACFASTKPFVPWELIWQETFETEKEARDFARYLKSNNGRDYGYKRLIPLIYNNDHYYNNQGRIYEV